jgi:hypothetical protein
MMQEEVLGGLVPEVTAREARHDLERGLVGALCRVSFMGTPASRGLFVQELAEAIGDGFDVHESSSLRVHVIAIVRECLRHRDGLHWLVCKLQMFAPEDSGTVEAAELARSFAVIEIVQRTDTPAVHDLLHEAEPLGSLNVEALWYAAADELAPLPAGNVLTLAAAFDHLTTLNAGANGLPPSLAFIEYVASHLQGSLAERLRHWNDAEAAQMGLSEELGVLRRVAAVTPLPTPSPPCVVILLEEHRLIPGQYLVSNWTQHRPGRWQPVRGETQAVPLADLARAVDEAVGHAEEAWGGHAGPVRLEFVLPVSLLNEPVEWWQTNLGTPGAVPLCANYPVVVRSLDRMRKIRLHRFWRNRWAAMVSINKLRTHWILEDDAHRDAWNFQLHSDESICAVVLGRPPLPHPDGTEDQLWMAIHAGVPVIIWDRRKRHNEDFKGIVASLASGLPVSLSERVKQLRLEAALADASDRERQTGYNITILWDDPDRIVDVSPYTQTDPHYLDNRGAIGNE